MYKYQFQDNKLIQRQIIREPSTIIVIANCRSEYFKFNQNNTAKRFILFDSGAQIVGHTTIVPT